MRHDSHVVNFRSEVDRLAPFLDGAGGVVHVRSSPRAPASIFARTIRTVMHRRRQPFPWVSVQIDPSNPNTHYVADILLQISSTCNFSIKSDLPAETSTVEIAKDIHARDVNISNVTVNLGEDPFEWAVRGRERVVRAARALGALLPETRVALIFLEMHTNSVEILRQVRRDLWDDALGPLTERGLLLIDISDPRKMSSDCPWPPPADAAFDLPVLFDKAARSAATDDLAEIAHTLELFDSLEKAQVFGKTLIAASPDIRDVHAGLARALLELSEA